MRPLPLLLDSDLHIKRLVECYHAGLITPEISKIHKYQIHLNGDDLQKLIPHLKYFPYWHDYPSYYDSSWLHPNTPDCVAEFINTYTHRLNRDLGKPCFGKIKDPIFHAWQERQRNRLEFEMSPTRNGPAKHHPFGFELSDGCTVGCWFCSVSSSPFKGNFLYTPSNAKLWQDILTYILNLLGPEASKKFMCYHATDPLDNPDYEKFLSDCSNILKTWPQTTTALALKDPKRTKALLKLSSQHNGKLNRFSILSPLDFKKIMETFSPEELAHVLLVIQFGPSSPKAFTGRAREAFKEKPRPSNIPFVPEDISTTTCISGFLTNMVSKKISLITPCGTSERWPNGQMVLDEGSFKDAIDFQDKIKKMILRNMATSVKDLSSLRINSSFKLNLTTRGFNIQSRWRRFNIESSHAYARELGALLFQGNCSPIQIAQLLKDHLGKDPSQTYRDLETLFNKGIFDECRA